MTTFSKFHKLSAAIVGVVISSIIYHANSTNSLFNTYLGKPLSNSIPLSKWDHNWDRQDVKSGLKFDKEDLRSPKYCIKASRHIILIRHGQYNTQGKSDNDRNLTNLGKLQAEVTGMRLAELSFPYTTIVRSTMMRARETSECIQSHLPSVPVRDDCLLVEGFPIPPDPASGHWKPEKIFFQDGPRMEAAFRRYFHRAERCDNADTYTIIVCHANIIRYFVCSFKTRLHNKVLYSGLQKYLVMIALQYDTVIKARWIVREQLQKACLSELSGAECRKIRYK